ncbi:MAG: leucine-rich repeat domain-containing protein [Chloroflexota bacterium]|nr:leucine-rich repeat domain-containing protein [Chloroflexota bacterium]
MPNPDDNPGLVQDCETLLAAKDALRGDAELNWSADTAMSGWTGVTVGGDPSRVTSVNLANRGLSGVIPSQLGSLAGLEFLYLHRNALTGEIPPELGNLSNLQGLYIQRNQLTGEIPSALGGLSNLTTLYILGNQLTGCIPATLRDVQNSDLSSTLLPYCVCANGIAVPDPDDNPGLVKDCEILLSAKDALVGNRSQELQIPRPNLLNWSADIPISDWNDIGIEGAPPRVSALYFEYAAFGVIPPQLGSLSNLVSLEIHNGHLTGGIPSWLGSLSNLRRLELRYNGLTGEIPPELGNLLNLTHLNLNGNQLTGEIPPELGNLLNLKYLYLNGNQLTGEIPSWLVRLSNLRYLDLSDNELTGCLPIALITDTNLSLHRRPKIDFCGRDVLAAFYNSTDGDNWTNNDKWLSDAPIGEWHGVTTDADGKVTRLVLRENNLVGELPTELVGLNRLEVLSLDGNSLSGDVPGNFLYLERLTRLALNRNNLSQFSDHLFHMPQLSILGLAKNENLSFSLPWWLATPGGDSRLIAAI